MSIMIMRYDEDRINGLKDLINDLNNNIIMLEIGSFSGESAEIFISSGKIKKMYCVDSWEDKYLPDGNMKEVENIFDERIIRKYNFVEKIKRNSLDSAELFENNFFDFVYLDGDHSYECVKNEIIKYFPKIKRDGFLGGHDYDSLPFNQGVVDAVNETSGSPAIIYKDTSWLKKIKNGEFA